MINFRTINFALIFGLSTSVMSPVYAKDPSYNYIEGGITQLEHDVVEGDFSGFEISASHQLPDNFYVAAKVIQTDDLGIDLNSNFVGIGYIKPLFGNTQLTIQLDAADITFGQQNAGEFNEKGFQWSVGFKSQINDAFEVELVARALDADQVDDEFGYYRPSFLVLGAHYKIVNNFSIYADLEAGSDSDRASFGVRYDY